jgi:hypothetical protein
MHELAQWIVWLSVWIVLCLVLPIGWATALAVTALLVRWTATAESHVRTKSMIRGLTKEQLVSAFRSGDAIWMNREGTAWSAVVHDTFLDSGLVVDHKDELCVFHAMPTRWYATSRLGEPDRVVLEQRGWTAVVEPIEKFLELEGRRETWFKIMRTGRPIRFSLSIVDNMKRTMYGRVNGTSVIGTYLSKCGRLPSSFLSSVLYYTPRLFEMELKPKEVLYAKRSEHV